MIERTSVPEQRTDEPEVAPEVDAPHPDIKEILRANDEHLRAIHRSTGRNEEWDRILKDWLLLYGWADAARKRLDRRRWGDSWDYIWSAAATIGALAGIYMLLWTAVWLSRLISGGESQTFAASIVVSILVGAPLGFVIEWLRRRSNK